MRLAKEEIHIGRLDLRLFCLLQVSVTACLDPLDVIRSVGVAHHPVRAQLIGLLGHYCVAIEGNPVLFLLEQR